MSLQTQAIALIAVLLTGCVATEQGTPTIVPVDANTLQTQLGSQSTAIVDAVKQVCQQHATEVAALGQQIQGLNAQFDELDAGIADVKKLAKRDTPPARIITVPAPSQCAESPLGDKFLLGEVESVRVNEFDASFATRIDTGAESSSIGVNNVVLFERDGERWVRFDVKTKGPDEPAVTFESKIARFVRIKEGADGSNDRRPVIHAHLQIGKFQAETDLNLTDRSHLDYPLLLGRKFMKDIAVVDVSRRFVHGKAKDLVSSIKETAPTGQSAQLAK
jgi:hypothetical protein